MADAHIKLGDLLGNPYKLHLNQFKRSNQHLGEALVLYQALFFVDPNNFLIAKKLVRVQRMLAAHSIFLDGQVEAGLKTLLDGLAILKEFELNTLRHKSQLVVQYVAVSHLLSRLGRQEEAAAGFRDAEILLQHPDDAERDFERAHNSNIYRFYLHEKAGFSLARKNYDDAIQLFEQTLQKGQDDSFWQNQRRSSRAHYALACIGLIQRGSIDTALDRLKKAENIIQKLIRKYPAAIPLRWELSRYLPLHEIPSGSHDDWIKALDCHNAHLVVDPPMSNIRANVVNEKAN